MDPYRLLELLPDEEGASGGLSRSFDGARSVASFRPSGAARYFAVAFLLVWLCAWAVGEGFALTALRAMLGGGHAPDLLQRLPIRWVAPSDPGARFAIGFLLFWLTFWTFGGLAALGNVIALVWASDDIAFGGDGVRLTRSRGPLRWSREFAREEIAGIVLDVPRANLVLRRGRRSHVLTRCGSRRERRELRHEMRGVLGLALAAEASDVPPDGWEAESEPEGGWRLQQASRTRRSQAAALWGFTLAAIALASLVTHFGRRGLIAGGLIAPVLFLLMCASGCGAGAAWLTWGHEEWRVRSGLIAFRRWFGRRERAESFESPRVTIDRKVDSDGDVLFTLMVQSAATRRLVMSAINDPRPPLLLGRWLAARANTTLELPADLKDSEAA